MLREDTYITAERFDMSESRPMPGMAADVHEAFKADWGKLNFQNLYGFPVWEREVNRGLALSPSGNLLPIPLNFPS